MKCCDERMLTSQQCHEGVREGDDDDDGHDDDLALPLRLPVLWLAEISICPDV